MVGVVRYGTGSAGPAANRGIRRRQIVAIHKHNFAAAGNRRAVADDQLRQNGRTVPNVDRAGVGGVALRLQGARGDVDRAAVFQFAEDLKRVDFRIAAYDRLIGWLRFLIRAPVVVLVPKAVWAATSYRQREPDLVRQSPTQKPSKSQLRSAAASQVPKVSKGVSKHATYREDYCEEPQPKTQENCSTRQVSPLRQGRGIHASCKPLTMQGQSTAGSAALVSPFR